MHIEITSYKMSSLANDVLLVFEILLTFKVSRSIMAKNGDKSCQSNFDKRLSLCTIHECTDAMCDVKFSFLEKLSLQREHWYSFFLSWADAIWHLILCVDEKLALQIEHLWGFIPWWTMAMWFFNLGRRAKLEPHKSHMNGFFPSCTDNICIFRVPYNGRC